VAAGGFVGGRIGGKAVPDLAWLVLNPAAWFAFVLVGALLERDGLENLDLSPPAVPLIIINVLSISGALFGKYLYLPEVEATGPTK
jgi:hypothetical protein